jgi:hypothetical protein
VFHLLERAHPLSKATFLAVGLRDLVLKRSQLLSPKNSMAFRNLAKDPVLKVSAKEVLLTSTLSSLD